MAPPGPSANVSLVIVIVTTGDVWSGGAWAVNVSVPLPTLPALSVAVQVMVTVVLTCTSLPDGGDAPQSIVGAGSVLSIAETSYVRIASPCPSATGSLVIVIVTTGGAVSVGTPPLAMPASSSAVTTTEASRMTGRGTRRKKDPMPSTMVACSRGPVSWSAVAESS